MKNRILISIILLFFFIENSIAEKYFFDVSKIDLKENGNLLYALDGKMFSKNKDLEISAEKFIYTKDKDYLEALNGTALLKNEKLIIKFNIIEITSENIFTAKQGIQLNDLKNKINIKSETMVLDRAKNILTAKNGIKIDDLKNKLNIKSETMVLDRAKNVLTAKNGIKIDDLKNELVIEGETMVLDRAKNILTAKNGIKIDDLKNELVIEGETMILDQTNNILRSPTSSLIVDKYENQFTAKKFEYQINKKKIQIYDSLIKDNDKNNFKIEFASLDLNLGTLSGENIVINLNNKFFNPGNEPRLVGETVYYAGNLTNISNGKFTACKKTEKCPPWELSADEIIHDKDKKSISYKNVWLNVYDLPVVYFPRFFHPDPTVKRQSGFLMPTFKNSPNKNTFFSVPYFKVLSDNKDFTLTPRFYAKDKLLIQNEYREVNKNTKLITDFSILGDDKAESHLFFNLSKNININNYSNSDLNVKIEQASNDTYLKANKLISPIINNYDVLENYFSLNISSDKTTLDTEFRVYENLNKKSSDKYEYIFPRLKLVRELNNNTSLNGTFSFESDNFIHNYDTNIFEKVNTNNLIFSSTPKITQNGFNNNYEFIIKNSNTDSRKSQLNKEGKDYYFSGLLQFNSNYPLIKRDNEHDYLLRPKLSFKLNPGHTKDLSKNNNKLDVNNIFNLDRISSNETLEGGVSIVYGNDFIITKKNMDKDFFTFKFANNLRINKNDDLERNNQIGSKTSNFFGEIKFSPFNFLTAKYDFSTLNNLSDINYQNLITEIKFDKFTNTFDYLKQDGNKNSYFLNETKYNFNEFHNMSFSTRENLKTDLTEYYNLIYQYKNDCLSASIEYQKDYYSDRDIKPAESIFFKLTLIPFGTTSSPNLKN